MVHAEVQGIGPGLLDIGHTPVHEVPTGIGVKLLVTWRTGAAVMWKRLHAENAP